MRLRAKFFAPRIDEDLVTGRGYRLRSHFNLPTSGEDSKNTQPPPSYPPVVHCGRAMASSNEAKNTHLTEADIKVLLSWIEKPANFESIYGTSGKTTVGGKAKITKSAAYTQMAAHLRSKTMKYESLKPRNMQQRWENVVKKFREVFKLQGGTGMGLTAAEIRQGVSLPTKLEKMCPSFYRLEALFGERPNMHAHATVELGAVVRALAYAYENDDASSSSPHNSSSGGSSTISDESDDIVERPQRTAGLASMTATAMFSPGTPNSPSLDEFQDDDFPPNPLVQPSNSTPGTPQPALPQPSLQRKLVAKIEIAKSAKRAKKDEQKKTAKKTMLTTNSNAPQPPQSNSQPTDNKPTHASAHETRMSLSQAYARNTEAKIEFLGAKHEEEKRQWNEKQAVLRQQNLDELQEKRSARKQALLIELICQIKSAEDIEVFMKMELAPPHSEIVAITCTSFPSFSLKAGDITTINQAGTPTMDLSAASAVCIRLHGSKTNQGGAPATRMMARSVPPRALPGARRTLPPRKQGRDSPPRIPAATTSHGEDGLPSYVTAAQAPKVVQPSMRALSVRTRPDSVPTP
ncbi:hypothetical protein ON010_g15694 [Phytophthora cinnamomi]|nr:hypothetical protein ON010_g15694 [Phytophthora cinnamomi]